MLTIEKPKPIYKGGTKPTGLKSAQLAQKVRYHRLQRGLSQQELADGICSMQLISSIERGTSNPRVKTLEKIADRLNVPLGEIYQPDEDEFPNKVKLQLVEAYMKRGEYEVAQETLDELRRRPDMVEVELQHATILQGEVYNKTGNPRLAYDVLQRLIDDVEVKQNVEDELLCKAYNQLGTAYYHLRNFTKAYSAYKQGHLIALRFPEFDMTAAIVTNNLGMVCNDLEVREDSKVYLEMARNYFESVSDYRKLADSYFHSAVAHNDETFLMKAKCLYESLECLGLLQVVRQYHAFHIESKIDYKNAVAKLLEVAVEFDKLNEPDRGLYTLSRAVLICITYDDFILARTCLTKAENQMSRFSSEESQYIPFYYLARAKYYHSTKCYVECLRSAKKASELYAIMGMLQYSCDALSVIVKVYSEQNKYREALEVSMKVNDLLLTQRKGGEK